MLLCVAIGLWEAVADSFVVEQCHFKKKLQLKFISYCGFFQLYLSCEIKKKNYWYIYIWQKKYSHQQESNKGEMDQLSIVENGPHIYIFVDKGWKMNKKNERGKKNEKHGERIWGIFETLKLNGKKSSDPYWKMDQFGTKKKEKEINHMIKKNNMNQL